MTQTRSSCRHCNNRGIVLIWNVTAMRATQQAAESGDIYHPQGHQTTTVRCHCKKGQRLRGPKAVFDPSCMCPYHEDLRDFIAGRVPGGLF